MATRYKYTDKWTPENITKLRELYSSTEDWDVLLKEFPFSTKRGIQGTATNLGLRKKQRIPNSSTEHKENLFNTWTEESAYILGYLEADGHVNYKNKGSRATCVTFCTSHKDLEFLEKLKCIVGFTGNTLNRTHKIKGKIYETKAFVVSSRNWKIFLQQNLRIGKIPEIPEEFLHHYIRGYFDGDGSIFWATQAKHDRSNFVFSSKELGESFAEKLRDIVDSKLTIHKKTSSDRCWYFNLGNQATIDLVNFLYKDASIFLERKYEKASKYLKIGDKLVALLKDFYKDHK